MRVNSNDIVKIIEEFYTTPLKELEAYDFLKFAIKRIKKFQKTLNKEMSKKIDEVYGMFGIYLYKYTKEFSEYILNRVIEIENTKRDTKKSHKSQ